MGRSSHLGSQYHLAEQLPLMDVQDWQRIARQELERRATSIVQALDDATLEAIAAGTLDMRAMCRQVADEIHQAA